MAAQRAQIEDHSSISLLKVEWRQGSTHRQVTFRTPTRQSRPSFIDPDPARE
jgi:hypothetical protein